MLGCQDAAIMPVIASHFHPPFLLRNGHVQTIMPVLFPRRLRVDFEQERLELEDGDFLDLHWSRAGGSGKPLAIVSYGLEGGAENGYVLGITTALNAAEWDVLVWDFRGAGAPNRLLRFYHSGETGDLGAVVRHAAKNYAQIALVGFSLGGNMTLKYMGEAAPHFAVVGAVGISAPVDLANCARAIDARVGNWIYRRRFLQTLIAKIEAKAARFPGGIDVTGLHSIRTFQEFDDRYTARIHGFRDAEDYWERSAALQFLPNIALPTLLLNARNDPLLTPGSFPVDIAEKNPALFLDAPESGGHVGFVDLKHGMQPWHENRVVEFLAGLV